MPDRSADPNGGEPGRIVADPCTGRPVLLAPKRRGRPIQTAVPDRADSCPFCAGRESETPPERDAVRAAGTEADQPGWTARAIPNLYPAAPWHEVIVEGAEHNLQPGALSAAVWADVLELYRRRITAFEAHDGVRCAFLFKNVGRNAGASIHHNHSQLLGLPELPPRLQLELEHCRGDCPLCDDLDRAAADGRVIDESEEFVWLSPEIPKLPFETWLLPRRHDADFLAAPRDELATFAQRVFATIDRAFEAPPFNTYLHRVPGEDFHWHFEIQPRTGFVAALELGGDMYINAVTPSECVAKLRGK